MEHRVLLILLLLGFTLLSGMIALKIYKNRYPEKTWKVYGLTIGFWGGAAVCGIILTAISLLALQWAAIL